MIEERIVSTCRQCDEHTGAQLPDQPPIDICNSAGCKRRDKQSIRKMNYCPKRKWSLLL
jgi:hypothetical protein